MGGGAAEDGVLGQVRAGVRILKIILTDIPGVFLKKRFLTNNFHFAFSRLHWVAPVVAGRRSRAINIWGNKITCEINCIICPHGLHALMPHFFFSPHFFSVSFQTEEFDKVQEQLSPIGTAFLFFSIYN